MCKLPLQNRFLIGGIRLHKKGFNIKRPFQGSKSGGVKKILPLNLRCLSVPPPGYTVLQHSTEEQRKEEKSAVVSVSFFDL